MRLVLEGSTGRAATGRRPAGTLRAVLPKEHGAWMMVYVPAFAGVGAGGGIGQLATWFYLAALTALFIGQNAVGALLRGSGNERTVRGLVGCAGAFAASGAGLLATGRWEVSVLLLPGGALFAWHALKVWPARRRIDRGLVAEISTAGVLTLSAAGAVLAARPDAWALATSAWGACFLFMSGSVAFVKSRVGGRTHPSGGRSVYVCGGLHVLQGLTCVLAWATLDATVAAAVTAAYAPAVARAALAPTRLPISIRAMGFREAGLSCWFGVWIAIGLRMMV